MIKLKNMHILWLILPLLSQGHIENRRISFLREFSASHGYFFQSDNTVDVYSMDPEHSITRTISKDKVETELAFFHDRYRFLAGSWQLVFHRSVDDAKSYLDLGPCDPMDQIDLSPAYAHDKALLGEVRIKDDKKLTSNTRLILYSARAKGETHLNAALVDMDPQHNRSTRVIDTVNLNNSTYCGYRFILVTGQKHRGLLFVYFHELDNSNTMIIKSYEVQF